MNDVIDDLRSKIRRVLALAQRANRLNKSAKRRLESFPLWKRLVFFSQFSELRTKAKRHELDRFMYTTVMLGMTRRLKMLERRARLM